MRSPGELLTAVLPVGGKGRRLGLEKGQKCICDLDGEPLLAWMLRELRDAGIRQTVLLSGHFREDVEAALPVLCSILPAETMYGGIDGDVAAILRARARLGTAFLLAGGDTVIPAQAIREVIALFYMEPQPFAACLASSYTLAAPEHLRIHAGPQGKLIRFLPAGGPETPAFPTNTGMHVLSAEVLESLQSLPEHSPPEAALEAGLRHGKRILVHVSDLPWFALHRAEDFEHWRIVSPAFKSKA